MNRDVVEHFKWNEAAALLTQHTSVLLTTPYPSCEIIYASDEFLSHVGRTREEVIGKNPKMFQGPKTTPASTLLFRELLMSRTDGVVRITNYHASGRSFESEIRLTHLWNDLNEIIGLVGIQRIVGQA